MADAITRDEALRFTEEQIALHRRAASERLPGMISKKAGRYLALLEAGYAELKAGNEPSPWFSLYVDAQRFAAAALARREVTRL